MSSSNNRHGKKRPYQQWKRSSNPQRGAPGILLTCETGREGKCRWEALQILQHDWDQQQQALSPVVAAVSAEDGCSENKNEEVSLSLDEELAKLKKSKTGGGTNEFSPPFDTYDTGVRGVVFLLCTGCSLIVPLRVKSQDGDKEDGDEDDEDSPGGTTSSTKKAKVTAAATAMSVKKGDKESAKDEKAAREKSGEQLEKDAMDPNLPFWNPLDVVHRVVEDIEKGRGGSFPSSRYITRMIPIQATCYAGLEDIQHAVESLVSAIVADASKRSPSESSDEAKAATTFAIQTKIRICGHLKRDQIIEAVVKVVAAIAPTWKVNLSEPDYTITVEVCKNIAGISVLPGKTVLKTSTRKFNLAELRTQVAQSEANDDE